MAQKCVPERSIYCISPTTQKNRGNLPGILVRLPAGGGSRFIPDNFKNFLPFKAFISALGCAHIRMHLGSGDKAARA